MPERKRMSTMAMMGGAFGLTMVIALGAYFAFGRGSNNNLGDTASPIAATVTLDLQSEPAGAQIYRDGVLVGVTPYLVRQTAAPGDAAFVLKKAGFQDSLLTIPGNKDGQRKITLAPTPAP